MANAPNGERVIALKGDSLESLAGLLARGLTSSFDAVYIDASHQVKLKSEQDNAAGKTARQHRQVSAVADIL